MILFRAAWDYIPMPVLNLVRYLPVNPFMRLRNVSNLFREYGKQILREQGPKVDAEMTASSKDVMSILSKSCPPPPLPNAILDGSVVMSGFPGGSLSTMVSISI